MSHPRSIAFIGASAPYPTDSGKKVVLSGLLDYWVDRLGRDAVHYVLVGPRDAEIPDLPARLHRIDRPRTWEQATSLARRTVAARSYSIQESMLYSPRVRRAIANVLASIQADLEIFDTIRLGQYATEIAPLPGQRRIVYLDDLFSVRYARMLETLRSHPDADMDPLGEFRSVIPAPLRPVASSRHVQRLLLRAERRLVAKRERESAAQFAACLLVSPSETDMLRAQVPTSTVHVLPPLVSSAPSARMLAKDPHFVLLGLLSLPHNHDAVMTFLRLCLPELVERRPGARIHIVGRGARPELAAEAARFPKHVQMHGFVPDLDTLLSQTHAVVVPLRFGSGIKIKVLEALAHGVPVLSTPVGAEGIDAGPGGGMIVEPDLLRFPALMDRLSNLDCNEKLSAAALQHHASTYSSEAAFRTYDQIFGLTEPALNKPAEQ